MNRSNFSISKKFVDHEFQCILDFDQFRLSVINNGMGSNRGLYEIATLKATDGENFRFVELPGITDEFGVKGYLTIAEVDTILKKMVMITGCHPKEVND